MIFGLYEKLLESILVFFSNIKENIKFLFPIIFGIVVGMIIFSNIIYYCFESIPCQIKSLFIGLLLGSTFVLSKSILKSKKSNISLYISFALCFFIGIALIFLENNINFSTDYTPNEFKPLFLILSGFFMSIGIVIPGISSTVILMILGVYSTYLSAISMVNMNVLFPMLIGVGIGSFIFMKIIQYLLKKYHSQTLSGIIGFSLGSIFILLPTYSLNLITLISIVLLMLGFIIGKNIGNTN